MRCILLLALMQLIKHLEKSQHIKYFKTMKIETKNMIFFFFYQKLKHLCCFSRSSVVVLSPDMKGLPKAHGKFTFCFTSIFP